MNNAGIVPIVTAFAFSALLGPVVIPILRRIKCGQPVRGDGPASHLKKTGTPTMGGILILLAAILTSLFYLRDYPEMIPVLLLMIGFGLIGLIDDVIKVIYKDAEGIKPWQKFGGQLLVTAVFACYIMGNTPDGLIMQIPFFDGHYLDFGKFAVPFLFLVVLGTVNGVNFTDGLDGLAASVTLIVAMFFTVVAVGTGSGLMPLTCAMAGALLGFLLFNVYPASVFMGDTGSLALGGFVAGCAYMMKLPLFIVIVGSVYLAEVISVILQVAYYKVTKGKRLFKMAPLHHHFELSGWSETKIVAVFTIFTAIMCFIALKGL